MKNIPELEEELETEKQKTATLTTQLQALQGEVAQSKAIGNEERVTM